MSGLIWSALGKGIANAGDMVGRYAIGQAEEEQRSAREIAREERLLARKDAQEEANRQRTIREQQQVQERADDMPIKRDVQALGNIGAQVEGDSPVMGEAEREALIRENPQYREIYRKHKIIEDKMDPRLQRADDESSAAIGIGASSSVIDFYSKKRADVLNAIKEENRDRLAGEKEDRLNQQFQALLPIKQQTANAATTRANKPSGGGGGAAGGAKVRSTKEDANGNVIAIMSDGTTKNLGIQSSSFNKQIASTIKDMEADFSFKRLPEAEKRAKATERLMGSSSSGGASAPKPSDNSGTRPPLSSFNRP